MSYNDWLVLFQTHKFTKTSVEFRFELTAANQMCNRLPLIISQFNSSSEHRFALSCIDHLLFFQVVWNTGLLVRVCH